MNTVEWSYIVYIVIVVPLTIYVARSLYRNGRVFLINSLHGNEELADSVNRLLLVGFYLINIGFVSLYLKSDQVVFGVRGGIELISAKVGTVLFVLGGMHFFNIFLFARIGRKRLTTPPEPYGSLRHARAESGSIERTES